MGIRVLDRETQRPIEVSGAEAERGLASGRFVLPDGQRVDVQRPDGRLATISPEDAGQAIASGYSLLAPEAAHQEQLRQEEDTVAGAVVGGLTEALGGATLGLSTQAAVALGADPERMRARQENLGGVGTALNLAGAVLPTLGTGGAAGAGALALRGGAGALARSAGSAAIRGATAPVRALTRVGGATERALARGVQGARGARQLVPMAGREAVMGAGFGVGQAVHESAIGDTELTAERLLADGGLAAVLGAGGAVGLAGLGRIASGGGRLTKRAVSAVMERAGMGGSKSAVDTLVDVTAKAQAWFTGGPEELYRKTLRDVLTKEGRQKTLTATSHMGEATEQAAREIQRDLNEVIEAGIEQHMFVGGAAKVRQQALRIPKEIEHKAVMGTAERLTAAVSRLDEMMKTPGYGSQSAVRELHKAAKTRLGQLQSSPTGKTAYRVADGFKRDVDAMRGRLRELTGDDAATKFELLGGKSSIRAGFKDLLEDASVWGDDVAAAQTRVNSELSTMLGMRDNIPRALKRETKLTSREALQVARRNRSFAGETETDATRQYVRQQVKVLDELEKHYDLDKTQKAAFHKARQAAKKFEDTLDRHSELAAKADDMATLRSYQGDGSPSIGFLTSPGTIAGYVAGGPAGALIGSAVTRPYTTARTLAGVLEHVDKVKLRINQAAVKAAVGKAASTSAKAIRGAATGATRATAAAMSREDRHKKARDAAVMYASNPDALMRQLRPQTSILEEFAPNTAQSMAAKSQRAAAFLQAKLPPTYTPVWGDDEPLIDDASLSQFIRYLDAVEDPIGAVERIADGEFTLEHAEAIREVYPRIFQELQASVVDELSTIKANGESIPYDRRAMLSMLVDIPLDAALRPDSIAAAQASHGPQEPEIPQASAQKMPPSRPLGDIYETQLHRMETNQVQY